MEETCRSDSPMSSDSCIAVLSRSESGAGESSSLIIENFKHDFVQTGNVTTVILYSFHFFFPFIFCIFR